jgi:hypothetical protein
LATVISATSAIYDTSLKPTVAAAKLNPLCGRLING